MDPRWCGVDGLDMQEVGLIGMLPAKVGSPWRHLCPSQALRVALCPPGLVLEGPGLLRMCPGQGCWQE